MVINIVFSVNKEERKERKYTYTYIIESVNKMRIRDRQISTRDAIFFVFLCTVIWCQTYDLLVYFDKINEFMLLRINFG